MLTVPSSAVHTEAGRTTVTVVENGATSTAEVTVGAIGTDLTQILTGLTAGQTVCAGRPHRALPTSTASTRSAGALGGAGTLGGTGALGGTGTGGGFRGGAGVVGAAGGGGGAAPPAG